MTRILKNETGKKYGMLTVLEFSHKNVRSICYWRCICDCGKEYTANGMWLRKGSTTHCGCKKGVKHGMHKSPEYSARSHMIDRCTNPKSQMWYLYGARGIKVCERWLESFENFYEDMGARPSSFHSLNRINSNGNYEPSNCRWATAKAQSNNTRRNRKITAFGREQNLTQWSEETGIHIETIRYRLKHGWTPEAAVSTPLRIDATRRDNPLRLQKS